MKKKYIICIIFVVLIVLLVTLKFMPMGTKKAVMGASLVTLDVPKLSNLESECCMYEANFKTIRSSSIIKKELEKIMNSKSKLSCNGKTYYYDKDSDVTITEYSIDGGLLFTKFKITYVKGNACK